MPMATALCPPERAGVYREPARLRFCSWMPTFHEQFQERDLEISRSSSYEGRTMDEAITSYSRQPAKEVSSMQVNDRRGLEHPFPPWATANVASRLCRLYQGTLKIVALSINMPAGKYRIGLQPVAVSMLSHLSRCWFLRVVRANSTTCLSMKDFSFLRQLARLTSP